MLDWEGDPPRLHTLDCGCQQYAWGKIGDRSAVAQFKKAGNPDFQIDDSKPYAELWVGTHPTLPSKTTDGALLSKHLEDNPRLLGSNHLTQFGQGLPFLLKILSVNKALSIQAHPDKALAQQLHAKDPEHYKDDNHKPELVVALTDFRALCCFRDVDDIKQILAATPALQVLFESTKIQELEQADSKTYLQELFKLVLKSPQEVIDNQISKLHDWLKNNSAAAQELHHSAFLSVNKDFPGDAGCLMVYLLNVVQLKAGEGLFLRANEPHAYISGDCVEIMAQSDNVVRAGLTPKFKDVDVLLNMLTYDTTTLKDPQTRFFPNGDGNTTVYAPPKELISEFQLRRVELTPSHDTFKHTTSSVACLLVISGRASVTLTGGNQSFVEAGSVSVIGVGLNVVIRNETEICLFFLAETQQ
eukprot:TRINITY_DN62175_c0_g1_i1.p1 TRINITY_DN62175_c0_g1~~TRINITY_DN62175_c0_g1_i1.p1  ORF type:complete len:415 (-),score=36.05 TRINITY_DN62175_c0_g1_i1:394-1638(-)